MRPEQLVPGIAPELPGGFRRHGADGSVEGEDASLPVEQREGVRGSHNPKLPRELPGALHGSAQRGLVEQVGSRVRDVLEWPVELAAAAGCVREIAHGNLVADDERDRLVAREQALTRAGVAKRGLVE